MSAPITSFLSFGTDQQCIDYCNQLIAEQSTDTEKQVAISYLKDIMNKDLAVVRDEQIRLSVVKTTIATNQDAIVAADPTIFDSLFPTINDAYINTRAETNGASTLIPDGYSMALTLTYNAIINTIFANYIGTAIANTLLPRVSLNTGVSFTGETLILDGLSVKGQSVATKQLTFPAECKNLTLKNCVFDGVGLPGLMWLNGSNNLSGDIVIDNCTIKNQQGAWLLFDNTNSGSATKSVDNITMKDSYFYNNSGSGAWRGKNLDTIKNFTMTGCKFWNAPGTLNASFWSSVECNTVQVVNIQDNEFTGDVSAGSDRGACQIWSKESDYASLTIKNNTFTNYQVAIQLAITNNTDFKMPTVSDITGNSFVNITSGKYMSLVYPWLSTTLIASGVPTTDISPANIQGFPPQ